MNIKQIKEKYTCLDYLGEPLKKVANGYLYRCPWRTDRNPSLSVSLNGKGWHDLSTDEHGNIIDLVCRVLDTTDFKRVCAVFDDPSSFPSANNTNVSYESDKGKEKVTTFASFEVVPLQKWPLRKYIEERRVSPELAKRFGVQEAHYSIDPNKEGYLYTLAYPNDKGGFELRGAPTKYNPKGFKGGTSPKGITTHLLAENAPYVVFEGFFDMLSFDTLNGGQKQNYLVLNSTSNIDAAIEVLKAVQSKIYICLDNDSAGDKATKQMQKALPASVDIRARFSPHNDVNDYLLARCAKDS